MFNTRNQTVERARELFVNLAQSEALQHKVTQFGYGPARLQKGQALLAQAEELNQAYKEAYGVQLTASDLLATARTNAHTLYTHHVSEARRAFRYDREALQTLELTAPRKLAFREWLGQATNFYDRLLGKPAYGVRLEEFNTPLTALQRGAGLVETARNAKAQQDLCIAATQAMGRRRQAAIKALRTWLHTFAGHARLALAATPEDLRALGLLRAPVKSIKPE